jgi:hypothetical protein
MKIVITLACFIVVLGLAGGANAIDIKLDIQPSGGTTASGFTAWTVPSGPWSGDSSTTVDGIKFTADYEAGVREYESFNYGGTSNLGTDYFRGNHRTATLVIGNLSAGGYTLTSYHNQGNPGENNPPVLPLQVNVISGGSGSASGYQSNKAASDAEVGTITLNFTATGGADVTITYEPSDKTDYWNRPYMNGLHLTPEPATVAILGLGSLVLLRRRR